MSVINLLEVLIMFESWKLTLKNGKFSDICMLSFCCIWYMHFICLLFAK